MSSRELIESLRRVGNEKLGLLKQETEQEAESLQAEVNRKIDGLRRQYDDRLAAAVEEASRLARADAENRARVLRLAAEKKLSDRLFSTARASLRELRSDGYPAIFEKLALELPALPWKLVRVHPADTALARTYFPDAEIVPVESISGGVDAATVDGSIRVVNTFEKRLERSWGDLLPQLVRESEDEAGNGTAPTGA